MKRHEGTDIIEGFYVVEQLIIFTLDFLFVIITNAIFKRYRGWINLLILSGINALAIYIMVGPLSDNYDNNLVRAVFEIKAIAVNGEFPGIMNGLNLMDGTIHAISYIVAAPSEKVYSFKVREDIAEELIYTAKIYRSRFLHFHSKSLDVMNNALK